MEPMAVVTKNPGMSAIANVQKEEAVNTDGVTPSRKSGQGYNPRMLNTSPSPMSITPTDLKNADLENADSENADSENASPSSPTELNQSMGLTEFPPIHVDELDTPSKSTPTTTSQLEVNMIDDNVVEPTEVTVVEAVVEAVVADQELENEEHEPDTQQHTFEIEATTNNNDDNNDNNDSDSDNDKTTEDKTPTESTPTSTSSKSPSRGGFFSLFRRKDATPEIATTADSSELTPSPTPAVVPAYTTMSTEYPSTIGMFASFGLLQEEVDELQQLREVALRQESTTDTVNACMLLFLDIERVSDKDRCEMAERLKVHARTDIGRNLIMQTGCVPNITFLLVDVGTVEAACNLIINLSFTHHESKVLSDALIESGVMQRLSWILEFASDPTKCAAIKALTNLIISDDQRKEALVQTEGFVDSFTRTLGSPNQIVALDAARLFCNLIKDDNNKIRSNQLDPFVKNHIAKSICANLSPNKPQFTSMIMVVVLKILIMNNSHFYKEFVANEGNVKVNAVLKSCSSKLGYVKTPRKRMYETFRLISLQIEEFSKLVEIEKETDEFEAAEYSMYDGTDDSNSPNPVENQLPPDDKSCIAALAFVTSLLDLADGSPAPSYYSIKSMVMAKFGATTLLVCKEDIQKILEKFYLGRSVDQADIPSEAAQQIAEEMAQMIIKGALVQMGEAAKQEAEEAESKRAAREELERCAWS